MSWTSHWIVSAAIAAATTGIALQGCDPRTVDLLPQDERADASGGSNGAVDGEGGTAAGDHGVVDFAGAGGAGGPEQTLALLVVDEEPKPMDDDLETRLEGDGIAVTRISELVILPEGADGFDLVVISPSADRLDLGSTLKGVAVPLLILETTVAADHGFGQLKDVQATTVDVVDSEHPIAGGQSGTVEVCARETKIAGNVAPEGVETVATFSDSTEGATIFALPAGTPIDGEPLAEKRVVLGILKALPCYTEASFGFFDRAVTWLLQG